jgi:hypothetical protein
MYICIYFNFVTGSILISFFPSSNIRYIGDSRTLTIVNLSEIGGELETQKCEVEKFETNSFIYVKKADNTIYTQKQKTYKINLKYK